MTEILRTLQLLRSIFCVILFLAEGCRNDRTNSIQLVRDQIIVRNEQKLCRSIHSTFKELFYEEKVVYSSQLFIVKSRYDTTGK